MERMHIIRDSVYFYVVCGAVHCCGDADMTKKENRRSEEQAAHKKTSLVL